MVKLFIECSPLSLSLSFSLSLFPLSSLSLPLSPLTHYFIQLVSSTGTPFSFLSLFLSLSLSLSWQWGVAHRTGYLAQCLVICAFSCSIEQRSNSLRLGFRVQVMIGWQSADRASELIHNTIGVWDVAQNILQYPQFYTLNTLWITFSLIKSLRQLIQ